MTLNSLSGGGQGREQVWIVVTLHVTGPLGTWAGQWLLHVPALVTGTVFNIKTVISLLQEEKQSERLIPQPLILQKASLRAKQLHCIDGMKRGKGAGMAAVPAWK